MAATTKLVDEGNEAFYVKDYSTAIDKYTQGINKSKTNPEHIIYANRSCAYSKQLEYQKALVDGNMAIEINSNHYLSWVAKSLALSGLGHLAAAREALDLALKFNPRTKSAESWISTAQKAIDSGGTGRSLNGIQTIKQPTKREEEDEQETGNRPAKKVKREGPDTTTSTDITHILEPEPETGVVFKFILEQSRALCSFPMAECSTSAALFTKFRKFFELLNKDTVVSVLSCRLGSQDERHYLFEGSEGQFALLLRDAKDFKGELTIEVRRVA